VESIRTHVLMREALANEEDLKLVSVKTKNHVVYTEVKSGYFISGFPKMFVGKVHCLGVKSTPISKRRSEVYLRGPDYDEQN